MAINRKTLKNNSSKISALIITFNEINHIVEALDSISFADEIIIIDSFSSDGTLELLQKRKDVLVKTKKFKNFADQRNFALAQANYDWVLFIDADERITKPLKEEILKIVNNNSKVSGFKVRRKHFFKNKPINFSGYQTDTTYRLFRNGNVLYDTKRIVHELPIIDGKSDLLKNIMLHYSFSDYQTLKQKMMTYGHLKALELFSKGKQTNTVLYVIKAGYKFFYNYVIRLGFLDGKEGLIICYLNALSVYYRHKELKRLSGGFTK